MEPRPISQCSAGHASDYGSDIDLSTVTSEYGSEFDPEEVRLVGKLLTQIASTAPKSVVYPSIQHDGSAAAAIAAPHTASSTLLRLRSPSVEVEYDSLSRQPWSVPKEERPADQSTHQTPNLVQAPNDDGHEDSRSPLERFRKRPQKPLSVTDLVSPAWCELQYWYALTKFGRKPRTAAMKQGSKVHRVLEEQVYEIVQVQVKSKEDRFGLKIWNTIQGLRTLRETGLTRELEVWGVVEGQVVNGIIDEISYTCPDPAFEESLEKSKAEKVGGTLSLGQLSIIQSFQNVGEDSMAWVGSLKLERVVYIADVKTRGVKSTPAGASLRPTWMQLMLYRKLLEALALNTVDAETIFARYDLKPLEQFTEIFRLDVGGMYAGDMHMDGENPFAALQESEIDSHGNLSALWSLMISEFSMAIDGFSDVLRAEFRWSTTGELIGSELTRYEAPVIEAYIASEMSWWRGERKAKGVEVEEAFKCRVCDFADNCTWRKEKIEEATEKHRLRGSSGRKSSV
ncbi:exonuclease V a 5' deoxyribonuclease-domain-containing protein [Clohesyomyces aquaticus]|uniref:Exonuclease V a 5' deoxyribonuclease-domain-containing protein n=1 Tax=Clohesyomyces aquaticus TaxID=1231657 RepID=A0A1Y1YU26_9PLEO|nr:exonuclease V a 5' deoxyribonuclease-domain-containing protein [Clohesyomyces aquaticus]